MASVAMRHQVRLRPRRTSSAKTVLNSHQVISAGLPQGRQDGA